jgi:hypothetical protein
MRSSIAENITKQNLEKRGIIYIYSLVDFYKIINTISIRERLKLDPFKSFYLVKNNYT